MNRVSFEQFLGLLFSTNTPEIYQLIESFFLFSFANTLEALYLNNNRLGILADNAFAQMTNLKELNLADNQLAALPPTLFTTQMNSLESLQVSAGTAVV